MQQNSQMQQQLNNQQQHYQNSKQSFQSNCQQQELQNNNNNNNIHHVLQQNLQQTISTSSNSSHLQGSNKQFKQANTTQYSSNQAYPKSILQNPSRMSQQTKTAAALPVANHNEPPPAPPTNKSNVVSLNAPNVQEVILINSRTKPIVNSITERLSTIAEGMLINYLNKLIKVKFLILRKFKKASI